MPLPATGAAIGRPLAPGASGSRATMPIADAGTQPRRSSRSSSNQVRPVGSVRYPTSRTDVPAASEPTVAPPGAERTVEAAVVDADAPTSSAADGTGAGGIGRR